jgi:TRAP-type C4-dicarboxylate transport system permease small subunit
MTLIKQTTARILGILCITVFVVLVVNVLLGVGTRRFWTVPWTEELARLLLLWLAMLGAALAHIENKHLGVDALTRALHPSARRIAGLVTHLAVFFFAAAVMIYGGGWLFIERWQAGQMMSSLPMKKAWFYLSLPVSGFLIALFALDAAVNLLRGRTPPMLIEEPKSTPEAKSA